jgi:hypothetical protein
MFYPRRTCRRKIWICVVKYSLWKNIFAQLAEATAGTDSHVKRENIENLFRGCAIFSW